MTFCMNRTSVIGNNSWKIDDDTMTGTLSKGCDGQTDRHTGRQTDKRTDRTIRRTAWSRLKISHLDDIYLVRTTFCSRQDDFFSHQDDFLSCQDEFLLLSGWLFISSGRLYYGITEAYITSLSRDILTFMYFPRQDTRTRNMCTFHLQPKLAVSRLFF